MPSMQEYYEWDGSPDAEVAVIKVFRQDLKKLEAMNQSPSMARNNISIDPDQEKLERNLQMKFRKLLMQNADTLLPSLTAETTNELSPVGRMYAATLALLHGMQHQAAIECGCETSPYSEQAKTCNRRIQSAVEALNATDDEKNALLEKIHIIASSTLNGQKLQRG